MMKWENCLHSVNPNYLLSLESLCTCNLWEQLCVMLEKINFLSIRTIFFLAFSFVFFSLCLPRAVWVFPHCASHREKKSTLGNDQQFSHHSSQKCIDEKSLSQRTQSQLSEQHICRRRDTFRAPHLTCVPVIIILHMDTLTSGHGMCFSRTSSCCIPTGGGVVWGKHCVKATLETKITFIAWKC